MTAYSNSEDATLLIPRPGARSAKGEPRPPGTAATGSDPTLLNPIAPRTHAQPLCPEIGINPILDGAATLLSLAGQLRHLDQYQDVTRLHQQCLQMVKEFERQLRKQDVDLDDLHAARYALCALIDETVLHTVWGNESSWGTHTLVATLHKETVGGERFFELLAKCQETPVKHLHLLELFYLCLALGFEGKLRLAERGRERLDTLRSELYHSIQRQRDVDSARLTPDAEKNVIREPSLGEKLPLWVGCALILALMLAIYLGFSYAINRRAEPAFAALNQIDPPQTASSATPQLLTGTANHLRQLLSVEINRKLLSVVSYPDHTTIRLQADNLFGSGSASLNESYVPILQKVAQSLETVKGHIEVDGHTDNQPIFTTRYPSNWHLSLARANAVVGILGQAGSLAGRLIAEGEGASQPLVANDSPADRARNRRVDINVYP
ncbi:type IVB secretion system protein IcmH/DotU [Mangrovitalea sediminis]|uniref:type IVB secretion system protein IcmH/DotU n=1 Tax=Mangrovitalea sediminis TaxID=1982043 RepID=UPI000BE5292C|nr:type IVB secretion system protein IcmH/DotU [Mangrovitalea sediminis]